MDSVELLKSISEMLKKHEGYLQENPEVFYGIQERLFKAIDYEDYEGDEDYDDEEDYTSGEGLDLFDDIPDEEADYDEDGEIDDAEADQWLKENDPASDESPKEAQQDVIESQTPKSIFDKNHHKALDYIKDHDAAKNYLLDTINNSDVSDEDKAHFTEQINSSKDHGSLQEYVSSQAGSAGAEEKAPRERGKTSRSGYGEWKPKDAYEDHHQEEIDYHMEQGYSHREAERLAGAHDAPSDFMSALKHKVKPSQPSEKMLGHMKELSADWLRNAERKISESADARKNPIKHASAKALSAHEDAHGNFKSAYDEFLQSEDMQGLTGRARHKAIRDWKKQYHEENPDHRESAIAAADAGKTFQEASETRKKYREEGKQAILDAGKSFGGGGSSEFSEAASGGTEGLSGQAAAQMVGGSQGEGGYSAGVTKDPAAVFAEQNPEYVASLRSKVETKLKQNPDQHARFKAINGVKIRKKGDK